MVWASKDITASDGGNKMGEEDTVVVINDRTMLVSGSTESGATVGFAIVSGAVMSEWW